MTNVRMYSKHDCLYCKAAKRFLSSKGIEFEEIDLLGKPDRQQEMVELSNRHTVPQIFFGDVHIGGYDDLVIYYRRIDRQAVNSSTEEVA